MSWLWHCRSTYNRNKKIVSIDRDTAYVRLWFEKEKKARNADIDMLVVAESEDMKDEHQYDRAVDAVYNVLVNNRTRPRKYVKRIPCSH